MSRVNRNSGRRREILEAFARLLEAQPFGRVTTAALARELGISEAALYRHFPSKARMIEGLIEFIEDTLFGRIRVILQETPGARDRLQQIGSLILVFAERNPGMVPLLTGDALAGETDRLRRRIGQLYERLETQFRQILREGEARERLAPAAPPAAIAGLLVALIEGKLQRFARSDFADRPTEHWPEQWRLLAAALLLPGVAPPLPAIP
ncbi:MAG: nucleoid occlusion factor SlmA [Pseudomonadota bacterium]|jgi:TetR/AcrR family transcriptional regulator